MGQGTDMLAYPSPPYPTQGPGPNNSLFKSRREVVLAVSAGSQGKIPGLGPTLAKDEMAGNFQKGRKGNNSSPCIDHSHHSPGSLSSGLLLPLGPLSLLSETQLTTRLRALRIHFP